MPSTRDIRRRIRGIKNIKQVTRAMNMIATALLRRTQLKVEAARPYTDRFQEVFQDILSHGTAGAKHPLLAKRKVHRIGVVLLTSDRGLAGAYNINIIRQTEDFIAQQRVDVGLITVGSKGRDYFAARGATIDFELEQPSRDITLEELGAIRHRVIADYTEGRYDRIYLAYTRFVSALKSAPMVAQLLPVETAGEEKTTPGGVYEFEPSAEQLLDTLLPQYVEVQIYRALVESLASEQASRMLAMKNATDSASEMIDDLTREYNRARQASITEEILEVVSGSSGERKSHER
jgi:F-type H+-transporting ATPase subunit gamma